MYLRARDYFADFEKVYGAAGVLPSLDGADHFRLRKSLSAAYSRNRLAGQMDELYDHAPKHTWRIGQVGDSHSLRRSMSRLVINAQLLPLFVSVDSQDIFDDHGEIQGTSAPQRSHREGPAKVHAEDSGNETPCESRGHVAGTNVQSVHTPAQRAGCHAEPCG